MSAVILAFPSRLPTQLLVRPVSGASPFSPSWIAEHAPLVEAGLDLCRTDDDEFARRCASMRDEDGRGLLGELALQLQRLGSHLADLSDALGLTAERISAELQAPQG